MGLYLSSFFKNWKSHVGFFIVACIVAAAYTSLRFSLNTQYKGATWQQIYDFQAAIPFGYRILIPIISRPLVYLGASLKETFIFWEFVFSAFLIFGLKTLFELYLSRKWAQILSVGFFYFLPLLYLLRFKWPLFYPYDTPALFFIVLGLIFIIKDQVFLLLTLVVIATLNRESTILLPMIYALFYYDKKKLADFIKNIFLLLGLYFLVRYGIKLFTEGNPMPYKGSMAFLYDNQFRVNNNIKWVASKDNVLILLSTFGFLPLFYIKFRFYVPYYMRRIIIAIALYLSMLFFIANLYEPRIFGEIAVLLWFVTSMGIVSYVTDISFKVPNVALTREVDTPLHRFHRVEKYIIPLLPIIVAFIIILINHLGVAFFYR